MSDDEASNHMPAKNLKIEKALFHPSFTFTGMQQSYVVNCYNGLVVKLNTNMNMRREQKEQKLFNRALAPIVAPEEKPFPRGKYPFYKPKETKKGVATATAEELARKHIDREFFSGHRYKVLFMGFVDGGSTLLTLDVRGYMYLWFYEKSSFTSEVQFKPTIKLKLELKFTKFILESSVRVFPPGKEKDINPKLLDIKPAIMDRIAEFMSRLNVQEIKDRAVSTLRNEKFQTTQFFVPVGEIPEEYGVGTFIEYLFNAKSLCIRAAENKYQAQPGLGSIVEAKLSKDKKYLVVHLLKDHLLSVSSQEVHEFVVVRILDKRLNTMKVSLDFEAGSKLEFDVSSEVPPFNLPYLYLLVNSYILIVSLVTGQIVNKFDYTEIISQNVKRTFTFDRIVSQIYTNIYLSSNKFDSILLFKLQNLMSYEEADSFSQFGKILMDIWNADGAEQLKNALAQPLPN